MANATLAQTISRYIAPLCCPMYINVCNAGRHTLSKAAPLDGELFVRS